MQLKKAVKKIVALGAGVTMMGATMMGALAADLSQYPEPFVANGLFDSLIVVGDNAKASDVIGSVDVATSLQYSMKQTTTISATGGATQVAVAGDAVEIGLPNDLLEINEFIGDVRETITEVDLEALRGGLISTSEGSTDYNQYIRFDESGPDFDIISGRTVFQEDENDNVGDFLFFRSGDFMFQYELEFEEGLESDLDDRVTDIFGAAEDLHDEAITILGTTYSIVDTRIGTSTSENFGGDSDNTSIKIEFISGEVLDTMEEGETKTFTIDGIDYEVEVIVISDLVSSVKFRINDEITDELTDGETDVLQDGLEIGIRDVIPNEAGDITNDLVEFYLGANKLQIEDRDYTDDQFEAQVEINEENIEEARARIIAETRGQNGFSISTIEYQLRADAPEGDIFVPPGHGLREYLDEPQGMISASWDIRYEGLTDTGVSLVKFDAIGDDSYSLKFTNVEGQNYDIPLADNSDDDGFGFNFGDEDDDLIVCEANDFDNETAVGPFVDEDDYFVVTDEPFDETAFTHVLRFESIDVENKELKFTDLGTGQREITFRQQNDGFIHGSGTLTVGGNAFDVYVLNETTDGSAIINPFYTGDAQLAIDLDNNGSVDTITGPTEAPGPQVPIIVQGGGIFQFPGVNCSADGPGDTATNSVIQRIADDDPVGGTLPVTLTTLSSEFDEQAFQGNEIVNITIVSRDNNEVGISPDPNAYVTPFTGATIAGVVTADKFNCVSETSIGPNECAQSAGRGRNPGSLFFSLEENDDIKQALTNYGVFMELFDESGDDEAEELTFEYPLAQRGSQVFVTAGKVSTTTIGTGGAIESVTLEAIEVGSAVLASEISDVASQNMIMVGGPCANEAARRVMGVTMENCAAGFTPGQAIIKLYDTGLGNVALLVAGDQPMDTRAAARVLANYDSYDLSGDEISITYTSLSDITVSDVV